MQQIIALILHVVNTKDSGKFVAVYAFEAVS